MDMDQSTAEKKKLSYRVWNGWCGMNRAGLKRLQCSEGRHHHVLQSCSSLEPPGNYRGSRDGGNSLAHFSLSRPGPPHLYSSPGGRGVLSKARTGGFQIDKKKESRGLVGELSRSDTATPS